MFLDTPHLLVKKAQYNKNDFEYGQEFKEMILWKGFFFAAVQHVVVEKVFLLL